jgi:hypothetical protein
MSPRKRSASTSPRKRPATSEKSGTLVCPECGRTFTRPASLGAHRNRAHGVAGSSKAAVSASGTTPARAGKRGAAGSRASSTSGVRSKRTASSRKTATTAVASGSRQRAARAQGAGSDRPRRTRRSSSDGRRSTVNRDGLLRSLFPTGIPAREDAIRQVNAWLDEAERLARMR